MIFWVDSGIEKRILVENGCNLNKFYSLLNSIAPMLISYFWQMDHGYKIWKEKLDEGHTRPLCSFKLFCKYKIIPK